ncbi:two-component response regulator [Synechococcus sp. WH 5701]|nr:two-component response regulator [Synechococcus sp. WH 5701]
MEIGGPGQPLRPRLLGSSHDRSCLQGRAVTFGKASRGGGPWARWVPLHTVVPAAAPALSRTHTIWVVDDDPELRQLLGTYLTDQGYEVRCLTDGRQLMARLEFQRPDLVVLDLMLPGDDGLTLLRRLRDSSDDLPVVMLTARGEAVDRIIGLEQGADDYLAKPFLPRELMARIEAVLRRRGTMPAGTPLADGELVHFGDNVLDLSARTLERQNQPVTITSGEFSLLAAFVQHPHRPLSRERLIELARGPASDTDTRSMDVQVSRVRRLVEPDPSRPRYLQTVWGYGYVFVPDGQPRNR